MQSPEQQKAYFDLCLVKCHLQHESLKRRIAEADRRLLAQKILNKPHGK